MTAKRQDITIEQGADYDKPFFLTDDNGEAENLTGMAFALEIRSSPDDPTALLTLTTAAGTLVADLNTGGVRPVIDSAVTAAFLPGTYVYDLKSLAANGKVRRRRQGNVYVSPQVTLYVFPAPAPSPSPSPSPSPDTVGMEDSGSVLQEDGSKILTEV
jgi:hypothetical protein